MSIFDSVRKSAIFSEFTPEEQEHWFSLKEKKSLHHIDTFYYSIKIYEARDIDGALESLEIRRFTEALEKAKNDKLSDIEKLVDFHGLSVEIGIFSNYAFHLSEPELYDVFIAKTVMTDDTPRIVVQLRTRCLIEKGTKGAIQVSLQRVREILDAFQLRIVEVNENRIDYAWHSNSVQNVDIFLADEYMRKHLRSNARDGTVHFNPQTWEKNYLALGNRRSNNLFARIYDKTREVVEEAYKGFFFDRWLQNGLINRYDHFCLNFAYSRRSYKVGLLCGRIYWYLEHGKDENRKKFLNDILQKYDIKSSNSSHIYEIIGGKKKRLACDSFVKNCQAALYVDREQVPADPDEALIGDSEPCGVTLQCMLPPTTTILNFEYMTKRAWYRTFDKAINAVGASCADPSLNRIWSILFAEKMFCQYLTGYGSIMSFVRDRNIKYKSKQLEEHPEEVYCAFWHRLRNTKINCEADVELFRGYRSQADIDRYLHRLQNDIASLSILVSRSKKDQSFVDDHSNALCYISDNELRDRRLAIVDVNTGEQLALNVRGYADRRKRRKRMMRNVIPHFED